ncbi:hypothetical protein OOU_Y34scaffold00658g3 [Pyricularia oryzae Y34]|uniref:Uncharacterized protein n=2 Tax=Pyricularia oryzae TaxID=318829 RepID=A0AA97PJ41_PYRO3|nr:hypothetical protein OOU_Y34scaffold00658g3 [Pyricularia oryzae Y34]
MRRKDFGIKLLMNVNLQAPSLDPSQAPFDYVCSLKSKNTTQTSDVQAQQRIPSLPCLSTFGSSGDEEFAGRLLTGRHKQTVLAILEKAGPSKQVTEMLHAMEKALIAEIQDVEDVMGVKNPRIRELFNAMTA